MINIMNATQQIELDFNTLSAAACKPSRVERRRGRAHWWFQQMRMAVDRAVDRSQSPPARPEQVYFPLPAQVPARGR